ncbi:hypothetical protein BpHYR1_026463 [Brachionus plicatilis]|uniref:Uncharacterized protein n=1 Tax=Brachionus plicatilis TaxID=10195 RepID=A0A3M7QXI4_BRAPC|nr:hypothetical protein BpHYR1_026463 [Brachionus plicatilis]
MSTQFKSNLKIAAFLIFLDFFSIFVSLSPKIKECDFFNFGATKSAKIHDFHFVNKIGILTDPKTKQFFSTFQKIDLRSTNSLRNRLKLAKSNIFLINLFAFQLKQCEI